MVNGSSELEGNLEVCFSGNWGTVCDDVWDDMDASVVCRQLGFSSDGALATVEGHFGRGTGLILLDNVRCTGSEARLADCPANPVGDHNCMHREDAGVMCRSRVTTPPGK